MSDPRYSPAVPVAAAGASHQSASAHRINEAVGHVQKTPPPYYKMQPPPLRDYNKVKKELEQTAANGGEDRFTPPITLHLPPSSAVV